MLSGEAVPENWIVLNEKIPVGLAIWQSTDLRPVTTCARNPLRLSRRVVLPRHRYRRARPGPPLTKRKGASNEQQARRGNPGEAKSEPVSLRSIRYLTKATSRASSRNRPSGNAIRWPFSRLR
jgi:hypothetical protein